MKKRMLAALFCALLVMGLAACGGSQTATSPATGAGTSADASEAARTRIVMVAGRFNDMSFQQSAYEGGRRIQNELSEYFDVEFVEMGNDSTVWESVIFDVAESNPDIIIGMGFRQVENFHNIPPYYPNIKFILLDETADFSGGNLSNLMAITFHSNESGFLAGAAAALFSQSDTIGFVGGSEAITVTNFLVGYVEGARAVNPDIRILTAYIGNFTDTATAKDLTLAQIAQGADVVFQVAGGAGLGVIEGASEHEHVMAIGVDADQYEVLAGTDLQSSVMTSSLKRLDNALWIIANQWIENRAVDLFGRNTTFGLGDDAVGIVFNDNLLNSIGAENVARLREYLDKIASGQITVSGSAHLTPAQIASLVAGQ